MSYLVSYRNGANKYGNDQGKAFKLPEPYKRPAAPANDNFPVPANDNEPKLPTPANDNEKMQRNVRFGKAAVRALGKLRLTRQGLRLVRLNPALNVALTALDVYDMLRGSSAYEGGDTWGNPAQQGYIKQSECAAAGSGSIAARFFGVYGPISPAPGCFTGQAITHNQDPHVIYNNLGQIAYDRFAFYSVGDPNQPRWNEYQFWYRTAPGARMMPRIRTFRLPQVQPVLDPWLLPIKWPVPLPVPLPMKLVHERLNDPLGSSRTNGDKRYNQTPRNPPREPPPPYTKEKKLQSIPAVVRALQAAGHGVSEALDLVDALHKALPAKMRAKAKRVDGKWFSASPQAKIMALWNGFDQMNWNQAMQNVAMNELQDRAIGRASGQASQHLNNSPIGRITGGPVLFLGPR